MAKFRRYRFCCRVLHLRHPLGKTLSFDAPESLPPPSDDARQHASRRALGIACRKHDNFAGEKYRIASDNQGANLLLREPCASVHGLPQQRFYNLLCLAYGADPVTFADVTENMTNMMARKGMLPTAEQGVLPKKRAENCEYEFQTFNHAWVTQIRPHIDLEMARTVLDTSWFPEPVNRVRLSPTAATPAAATPAAEKSAK